MEKEQRLAELDRLIRLQELDKELRADSPQAAVETPEKDAWYEDLGEGLAVSGMDLYYGIKELAGKMTDEDRARLEDWRTDAGESIWGGLGQGLGELAQMAVPGAGALKLAKMLGKGRRLLPFAADVASSAGFEAFRSPDVGESRLTNALGGAGSAVLGGALGRTLSKPFRGIKYEDEARELMDRGVKLTPGQAASGSLPRAIEQIGNWKLFTGKGVQTARQKGIQDWNKIVFEAASPPGKIVSDIGETGLIKLKKAFDSSYSEAWKNAKKPSNEGLVKMVNGIIRQGEELSLDSQHTIRGLLKDVVKFTKKYSKEQIEEFDKKLRRQINTAFRNDNHELGYALKDMKADLRSAVGENFAEKLKAIDSQYDKYRTVRKAAVRTSAMKSGKVFKPDDLIQASKQVAGESRTGIGANPLQKEFALGEATVGRKEFAPLIDMRKALIANSPDLTMGGYSSFGNALMGRTNTQKAIRNAVSPLGEALRNMGVSSTLAGGAFLDGDY